MLFFKKKKKPEEVKIVIDENIGSTWFYHLRYKKKDYPGYYKALCGDDLLGDEISLEFWGFI